MTSGGDEVRSVLRGMEAVMRRTGQAAQMSLRCRAASSGLLVGRLM